MRLSTDLTDHYDLEDPHSQHLPVVMARTATKTTDPLKQVEETQIAQHVVTNGPPLGTRVFCNVCIYCLFRPDTTL